MSKFTASNGARVWINRKGVICAEDFQGSDKTWTQAIREFFQHERDQELGRWRWPENPEYMVYPRGDDRVRVVYEATGGMRRFERAVWSSDTPFREAAKDYFDAHQEPKPWDEAEDGEVWALTGAGGLEQPFRRLNGKWLSCTPNAVEYSAKYAIDGRRIWPEDSNDS